MPNPATIPTTNAAVSEEQFLNLELRRTIHYIATVTVNNGVTPAAQEIYINGEVGRRLKIPADGAIIGFYSGIAVNSSTGVIAKQTAGYFSIGNDGGVVTMADIDAAGSANNPVPSTNVGAATGFTLTVDDTNDTLLVRYTGIANETHKLMLSLGCFAYRAKDDRPKQDHVIVQTA